MDAFVSLLIYGIGLSVLALKVDVDTLRGTLEGVPRLLRLLDQHEARATFLFSLGPDHTGWAIRRVFRRGFVGKVARTSVLSHYGLKTLLYGTLLPGPDIGLRAKAVMKTVQQQGFEVGIHTWDHVLWQDHVASADAAWTAHQITLAKTRFSDLFGISATVHGAAGWQMNAHAFKILAPHLQYASDTRGTHPFLPMLPDGTVIPCPQLPTTLPTLDEWIGQQGITPHNAADHLLSLTENPPETGHVFTLHAELEGGLWSPIFERLLVGWKAQGYQLGSLQTFASTCRTFPIHRWIHAEIPGRSGTVSLQGDRIDGIP